MEKAVSKYLRDLGIPVSGRYFERRIASHPDYPSILAVADTLQQLGISHTVARANKENLSKLPLPVLLHLDTAGGSLLQVNEPNDLEAAGDKLNHWSGVLLKAESTEQIADKENAKALVEEKRFKFLAVLSLLVVAGLVFVPLLLSFSWLQLILLTTVLAGVGMGYVLFAKDLGITYRAMESFCNAGTGAGCGKVLRSEDGKLFGFITFSDLTLGYFAAQLIATGLFVPLWSGSSLLTVLGWMSILAVPVIGYSLWLQAVKIKEWCRLCLMVNGILAIQALFFGFAFYTGLMELTAVTLPAAAITLLLFGATGSSLLLLKQTIQQKNRAVQNEIDSARLKNSPDVFTGLLFSQRQVDVTPFENDFLLGSPDAPIKLTMAVNLYCGPCKNELEKAKELLGIFPGHVNLSLRFLKSGDVGKSSSLLLKKWLQQRSGQNNGMPNAQALIEEWYAGMNADKFEKSHPVNGAVSEPDAEAYLQAHCNWIKAVGITKTPTTFMNGYELPAVYRVKDLVSLIPGLVDAFGNQNGLNAGKRNSENANMG